MTRKTVIRAVLAAIGAVACVACAPEASMSDNSATSMPSIIPAPRTVVQGEGAFEVAQAAVSFGPDVEPVARYFVDLVRRTTALSLEHADAGGTHRSEITFVLARADLFDQEGYSLAISPRRVVVTAGTRRGLFYGAVSLWQLMSAAEPEQFSIPAMTIEDAPRFRWRGLMLDSARHYQSPEFVKKLIDVMALHKLNVLHWHLVDDQAWRLEIKKFPKLTSVGAWRVPAGPAAAADIDPATGKPRLYGGFYSQDQVREIVAYAAERYITIVPEIEMPGHASAAIAAYPKLGVSSDASVPLPPSDWGVYPNLFNVDDTTFAFLEDVLSEVMQLFPSEYIHVGGDEAVKEQWRSSAAVQARMRALGLDNENALQSWFIQRIEKFLNAHGRRLIGWDEILEGGLAPDATVMSWRGIEGAIAAATAGHDAVLSPHPVLYFDHRPLDTGTPPGRGRVVSMKEVYHFDPAPRVLTQAQRQHILGIQANVWTEHIRTEDRVEYMTFPRAAALAEVAWSPSERIDWESFEARLPAQLDRYRSLDVRFADPSQILAAANDRRRTSHELDLCSENLVLSLEDDAPIDAQRAIFLVDIMNPCWIYRGVDLSAAALVRASIGQAPFNFQIGADVKKIPLRRPATPAGELEVRLDRCDGEKLAALSLAPAANNHAVTELPAAAIGAQAGNHDLCFMFTRASVDPIWLIDSVEITRASQQP